MQTYVTRPWRADQVLISTSKGVYTNTNIAQTNSAFMLINWFTSKNILKWDSNSLKCLAVDTQLNLTVNSL